MRRGSSVVNSRTMHGAGMPKSASERRRGTRWQSFGREAAERGKGVGAGLGAPGTAAEEAAREARRQEGGCKQEEKEEEEEGKGAYDACQKPGGPFRHDRPRPQEEVRRKLRRKAKRLGRKARARKSSTGSSSSSSSSGNLDGGRRPVPRSCSLRLSAPQRIWRRYPGVLTSTMILEAQRVMMLQLGAGTARSGGSQSLRPMVTQYCRQHLMASMAATSGSRSIALVSSPGFIIGGKSGQCAMDVMTQTPEEFRRAEQVNASRSSSPTRVATPGSRGSGDRQPKFTWQGRQPITRPRSFTSRRTGLGRRDQKARTKARRASGKAARATTSPPSTTRTRRRRGTERRRHDWLRS